MAQFSLSSSRFGISGMPEAIRFFNSLSVFAQDTFMKSVMREASKPVRDQAIINAPLGPEKQRKRAKVQRRPLKESIKTVSGGSIRKTGEVGLVRTGALRRNPYRAYHANFLEQYNFRISTRPAGGWYKKINPEGTTTMPKKAFMEPAIDQKSGEVEKRVAFAFEKKINELMKRYLRRGLI
jgi:HK97 gp10 family phage protein